MRVLLFAGGLVLALVAAGCGSGDPGSAGGASEPPSVTKPAVDPAQILEGSGTVLDDGSGPQLCLGGVAESLPPQCSGIPLVGWDWGAVEGEESAAGTTWGDFQVVGTYDGEVFTVTDAGPFDLAVVTDSGERDFTTPCPEPEGGWVAEDPAKAGDEAFGAGATIAQGLPGYVTLWVDYAEGLPPEELDERAMAGDPVLQIMNVVVTDDVEGAEAAIREAWRGPLCVTEREGHTEAELVAIREEAERFIAEELGLEKTWSQDGDAGSAAEVGVVVDPGGAGQAALDARYGAGIVRLYPGTASRRGVTQGRRRRGDSVAEPRSRGADPCGALARGVRHRRDGRRRSQHRLRMRPSLGLA